MRKQWPNIVKLFVEEDGNPYANDYWHLGVIDCGDPSVLCTGEYFGDGTGGIEIEGKDYVIDTGKVTCPLCLNRIKYMQTIRLR